MKKYNNLNGLRSFAAVGIICMHVLANTKVAVKGGEVTDYLLNTLIGSFGAFVQLFFIISGFGMCCGYYEKIKAQTISVNDFYNKRYLKILPFFTLLVLMDLGVSLVFDGGLPVVKLYEAFADLTLMFGFYTVDGMSVIGVGWTLGVTFGFYILFPFFVYLLWNKQRAWCSLLCTIGIAYVSREYFGTSGSLTFAWLCFFIAGGLIFLYRQEIERLVRNKGVGILITMAGFIVAYVIRNPWSGGFGTLISTLKGLVGFSMMLIGALGPEVKIWSNSVTNFISGVSLEIYLAHMMVFRVIEKTNLTSIAGNSVVSYVFNCLLTAGGALLFAAVYQREERRIKSYIERRKER